MKIMKKFVNGRKKCVFSSGINARAQSVIMLTSVVFLVWWRKNVSREKIPRVIFMSHFVPKKWKKVLNEKKILSWDSREIDDSDGNCRFFCFKHQQFPRNFESNLMDWKIQNLETFLLNLKLNYQKIQNFENFGLLIIIFT